MYTVKEVKLNAAKNVISSVELFKVEEVTDNLRKAIEEYVKMKNLILKVNGSDNRVIVEYSTIPTTSINLAISNLHIQTLKDAKSYNHIANRLNRAIKATNKINLKKYDLIEEIDIIKLKRELESPFKD